MQGVSGTYSPSLKPVNQRPTRPEAVVGEWRQTVAKRPPVIRDRRSLTPIEKVNKGGSQSSLPPFPLTTTPQAKSLPPRASSLTNDTFSLICFAQLNFRGHPATSCNKGPDPRAEVKSGTRKTRSPLARQHTLRGNPSISTTYHDIVKKWVSERGKKSK